MARNLDVKNYLEPLFHHLDSLVDVSKEDIADLLPFFEVKLFDRKAQLVQMGEMANYIYVVMTGMLRKYLVLKRSKQITLQIATEGHFIYSDVSFNLHRPSEMIIEAVEMSTVLCLHHEKLKEMLERYPNTEELARLIFTKLAVKKDHRYYNLIKNSPRDRFLDYLARHQDMLHRAPQKVLASYLNIKPETFSRLKHLIKKKPDEKQPAA